MTSSSINVLLAVYASNTKGFDVTSQVATMVGTGSDDVSANNGNFGDPDPGSTKYFFVWYTSPSLNNQNPIGLACEEGQTIDLIPSPTPAPPAYYYSTSVQPTLSQSATSTISVKRAVYGTGNNGIDVTALCQALVNQAGINGGQSPTAVSLPIGNTTFGGDPDYGNKKFFAMEYAVGGSSVYAGGAEGDTLTLNF